MAIVPGKRILQSNSNDDRVQAHPDNSYAETELGLVHDASDGTGVDITVATAGTPVVLKHASAFTGDSIGDVAVDETANATFTIKHAGKYRFKFEGRIRGENSAVVQLSCLKDGTEEAASLRQFTEPAAALNHGETLEYFVDCVSGTTLALGVDSDTNSDAVAFDGFTLTCELVESHEG